MFRHITYLPAKSPCSKPTNDVGFHSNPPQHKLGFVDGDLGEKKVLHDKTKEYFNKNSLAMARRDI